MEPVHIYSWENNRCSKSPFFTVAQLAILCFKCPCLFKEVYAVLDLVLHRILEQRWLVRAKEHLRTYLQEQQGRGSGRRKSQVNSVRKTMSSSDVSRLFDLSLFHLYGNKYMVLPVCVYKLHYHHLRFIYVHYLSNRLFDLVF